MELPSTRTSLMTRLRDATDHGAWREFESRYRELMVRYCQKRGLQRADAEDVIQSVFANLAKCLPGFDYDPARGRFRGYLFRCVRNGLSKWNSCPEHFNRRLGSTEGPKIADDEPTPAEAQAWEQEWIAHHYRVALETVRRTLDPRDVAIFDRSIAGAKVSELAAELGMTPDAVHKVRQRVRDRMEALISQQIREEDEV